MSDIYTYQPKNQKLPGVEMPRQPFGFRFLLSTILCSLLGFILIAWDSFINASNGVY